MPHLGVFRGGWTNERLAELILSGLAFVGKPSLVADDIGADFYCTLINRRSAGTGEHLIPTTSFVVQVKSSARDVSLTKHIPYLARLEAPFFIGVADTTRLTLTLYSGRYLPFLLAQKGTTPKSLTVRLAAWHRVSRRTINQAAASPRGRIRLPMPKLITLKASSSAALREQQANTIHDECVSVGLATYNRLTGQYVLPFPGTKLRAILAGPGTVKNFRLNFENRLTEYMKNVEWLMDERPDQFRVTEARTIIDVAQKMRPWLDETPLFKKVLQRLTAAIG
jgi:hypothetical protein